MSETIEKIKNAKESWYWSLKPGCFTDSLTGKDPYPDMVKSPWSKTIEEWNASLIEACIFFAFRLFGEEKENVELEIPDSIYGKMTPSILQKWPGKIKRNNSIPFNKVLLSFEGKSGVVNVLNINEKGNLV